MRGVQDMVKRLRLLVEISSGGMHECQLTVFCFFDGLDPFVSLLDHYFKFLLSGR